MSKMHTRLLVVLFKVALSLGLIGWIISGANLGEILASLAGADIALLALAFSLFFGGYAVVALRWRTLLAVHGVHPPLSDLIQAFMVSLFFNNFLPSTIGGDASRVVDSYRFGGSKAVALLVVVVDRFVGMCAMLALASIAILAAPRVVADIPALRPVLLLVIAGAIVFAGFLFGVPRGPVARVAGILTGLPGFTGRLARKVLHPLSDYWDRRSNLTRAFALSLMLQIIVIIHYILLARALHIHVPHAAMFVVMPAVFLVMMIPATINAIGIREAAFVYFFAFFDVGAPQAVALAWVQFAFVLVQGLLGGIVFALRRVPAADEVRRAKTANQQRVLRSPPDTDAGKT